MDRNHLNQRHMKNANCLQDFVHKNVQNVHHLYGRPVTLSSLVNCSVSNDLLENGPYRN